MGSISDLIAVYLQDIKLRTCNGYAMIGTYTHMQYSIL